MDDARERILRATSRLIGEGGIGAVTNRRVATAAGVSLGSLTYHFPNQAALLQETSGRAPPGNISRHVDQEIGQITGIVAGFSAPTRAASRPRWPPARPRPPPVAQTGAATTIDRRGSSNWSTGRCEARGCG